MGEFDEGVSHKRITEMGSSLFSWKRLPCCSQYYGSAMRMGLLLEKVFLRNVIGPMSPIPGKLGLQMTLVLSVLLSSVSMAQTIDVTIETDTELWQVSDTLIGFHLTYQTIPDKILTRKLEGKDVTLAAWAKATGIKHGRYPGGTTLKNYHWENPSYSFTEDPWAPNYVKPNRAESEVWSLDDYLKFVTDSGIKPHIGINSHSGFKYDRMQDSIDRAARQVQYILDAGHTGAVYYIGNEEDHIQGGDQAAAYIDRMHIEAIKALDPTCKVIWNNQGIGYGVVRRMLNISGDWLEGFESHTKWPKTSGVTFEDWQTTTPMESGGRVHRNAAKSVKKAALRAGFPNFIVANNEYGGGGDQSTNGYELGLIMTEQLLELFIGNYDMSAYWNLPDMLRQSGTPRLKALHHSWELMAPAQGATYLEMTDNGENTPGFAVKTDDEIFLYLLNKASTDQTVNVDFTGFFDVKTDAASGLATEDANSHWGALQTKTVTHDNGTFTATLPALTLTRLTFPFVDRTETNAPAAPAGLTATYMGGAMNLDWADSPDGDLHEYRVYRSRFADRDFKPFAMSKATSEHTDDQVINGRDWYYKVSAIDTNRNESALTAAVRGRMPAYERSLLVDFEICSVMNNTTAVNLDQGTTGGSWSGILAAGIDIKENKPSNTAYFDVPGQAMKIDPSEFWAPTVTMDSPISLANAEVSLDVTAIASGSSTKNVKIRGIDDNGKTSFSIVLNMDSGSDNHRLAYLHPDDGLTMFPEGKKADLDDAGGGNYDPPLDTIKLFLSSTGYRVEIIDKNWVSAEVPYQGAAANLSKIKFSGAAAASVWIDNIRVSSIIPPDDGSNTAPAFTADPIEKTAALSGNAYTENLSGDASDVDGDVLTFSRVSGPYWLNVRADGLLYGTPVLGDVGPNRFQVKVADPYGAAHIVDLELFVNRQGNSQPSFTNDPIIGKRGAEGVGYSDGIEEAATDPDNDTLSYAKTGGPAWLAVASNGSLSGTPTSGDVGTNQFMIEVSDGAGGSATATLEIEVENSSVLAGWNQFPTANEDLLAASETSEPTISGSLAFSHSGVDWFRGLANRGSSDQTYGSVVGAPGNANLNSDGLRCKVTGEYLDFTITNNNPSSNLVLKIFSFDAWRSSANSISAWTLSVLPGSSITTGVIENGNFASKGEVPSDSDFDDFDIALTGLADNTLAFGESATLRMTMGATSGEGYTYLDNFAFSGVLNLLPDIKAVSYTHLTLPTKRIV